MKEEILNVQGLQVNYKIAGEGPALFILHGWGSSAEKWESVQIGLAQKGYKVIIPDLPGFGLSEPPKEVWGIEEYQNFVVELADKLGIKRFSLAGHSFGGQITIQFAVNRPEKVEKLILLAAAGVRREPGIRVKTFRLLAKLLNFFLLLIPSDSFKDLIRRTCYSLIGWRDYAKEKGVMREVMAKSIREDLTHVFSQIKIPTLIIWGDKDKITPLEDAFLMKKLIKDSFLSILPGVGHRLRAEAPEKLIAIITRFLRP